MIHGASSQFHAALPSLRSRTVAISQAMGALMLALTHDCSWRHERTLPAGSFFDFDYRCSLAPFRGSGQQYQAVTGEVAYRYAGKARPTFMPD